MYIDTKNVKALELLKAAQISVSLYQQSKELKSLEDAKSSLEQALQRDGGYLRARFWKGLVNDLLGKTAEAVVELQEVKETIAAFEPASGGDNKTSRGDREIQHFFLTVEYNLGVAKYHQYSGPRVEEGIKDLQDVIDKTENRELKFLAKAWLAKAYAVKMIPKIPPINPETKKELYKGSNAFQRVEQYLLEDETPRNNAQKFFDLSEQQSAEVVEVIENGEDLGHVEEDVKGLVYDAKAIAIMFHTDFYAENRIVRLEKALTYLREADKYRKKDWAIYCNFGSINMRLGYWRTFTGAEDSGNAAAAKNFGEAHRYLDKVINELRPGYGFALYEKGRAYRLNGDFKNAVIYFKESLAVPQNRDVSDRRLEFEMWRADEEKTTFP